MPSGKTLLRKIPEPKVVARVGYSRIMKFAHVALSFSTLLGPGACDASRELTAPDHAVGEVAALQQSSPDFLASGFPQSSGLPADHEIDWRANPVMRELGQIGATMTESRYSHVTRVSIKDGIYEFDCSSMVSWVLRRATPVASQSFRAGLSQRPLARDFQRHIARLPENKARFGWQRISRVEDARAGDVVAWVKPDIIRSPYTGHVAFIVLAPVPAPNSNSTYLVRVADASSLLHDDDTRQGGRTGFGLGTIVLEVDPVSRAPIAYGWVGLKWRTFNTAIAIGRALK